MRQNRRMRPRLGIGLLLIALLLSVVGCQPSAQFHGKPNPTSYRTIISLSPSTTEIAGTFITDSARLKGRTSACDHPDFVRNIEVVGSVKPDYEKIAALKPDLILYDKTLYTDSDIEKLKAVAPQADLMVLDSSTIARYIDFLYRFAAATGSETQLMDYAEKVIQASGVGKSNPPDPKPKVITLIGGGPNSEYMAAGTKSFLADVVRDGGGEPVGPESDRFEVANVEHLVKWNPDLIFTSDDPKTILSDPRLKDIGAVKGKAVLQFRGDVLLRAGARVDKLVNRARQLIGVRSDELAGRQ